MCVVPLLPVSPSPEPPPPLPALSSSALPSIVHPGTGAGPRRRGLARTPCPRLRARLAGGARAPAALPEPRAPAECGRVVPRPQLGVWPCTSGPHVAACDQSARPTVTREGRYGRHQHAEATPRPPDMLLATASPARPRTAPAGAPDKGPHTTSSQLLEPTPTGAHGHLPGHGYLPTKRQEALKRSQGGGTSPPRSRLGQRPAPHCFD